jgi:hypothetical protein
MAMPGSCNRGFRSRPSAAAGSKRSKGFEVSSRNRTKPTVIRPITPSALATVGKGRRSLKAATATVHSDRMKTQSNIEPSCPPQTAVTL